MDEKSQPNDEALPDASLNEGNDDELLGIDMKSFAYRMLVVGALVASGSVLARSVQAFPLVQIAVDSVITSDVKEGGVVLIDAQSYRHCHNISPRVYCQKSERLPSNWPPLSDTPHSNVEVPNSNTRANFHPPSG